MTTFEQTIETIKAMPLADRQRLQQWLREQEQHDVVEKPSQATEETGNALPRATETVEQQLERFHQARKWLAEHRAEYPGQWVALEGDRLISHGPDALQVHRAAKAAGISAPFLEHIVETNGEEGELYWGGWLA